ncbi:MAG: radical SAM protein [Chloroflexota bacterium]
MVPVEEIVLKFGGKEKAILAKLLPKLLDAKFLLPLGSNLESEHPRGFCGQHDSVSLLVTLKCNLRCRHCSANAGPDSQLAHPPLSDLICILEKIISLNPRGIDITGGEPFFRADILELLRQTRSKYAGQIVVQTNATLITKSLAKSIAEENLVDSFDISLDGVDEASCAPIRGRGTFLGTIRGIRYLQDAGIKNIATSMVVTKDNYHLQPAFAKLNKDLGTNYMLRTFSPAGRGKEHREEFDIPLHQSVQPMAQAYREKVEDAKQLDDENYKRWLQIKSRTGLVAKMQCSAGLSTFSVMPNGDVFPCPVLIYPQFLMGNLLGADSFQAIMDRGANRQLVESFQIDHRPGCHDCEVRYFCIGGCMGENHERTGDHLAPPQECSRFRQDLSELVWG